MCIKIIDHHVIVLLLTQLNSVLEKSDRAAAAVKDYFGADPKVWRILVVFAQTTYM